MFGSALIVQAIGAVLIGIVTLGMFQLTMSFESVNSEADFNEAMGPFLAIMASTLGVSVLIGFLGSVLQGVLVVPVARSVLNRRTGFKQMWKLAGRRILPLLGVAVLLTLGGLLAAAAVVGIAVLLFTAMGPGALLVVLPLGLGSVVLFVWIGLKLMLAPAAIVVERTGVYDGLLRSWQLTKNNWWRIFGITLVVAIMVGIIAQIVQIPASLAATAVGGVVNPHPDAEAIASSLVVTTVISSAIGALVGSVTFAFQASVFALIYMDLRMRRDGLDVELMRLMETGDDPEGIPGSPSVLGPHSGASTRNQGWPSQGAQPPAAPPGPWPPQGGQPPAAPPGPWPPQGGQPPAAPPGPWPPQGGQPPAAPPGPWPPQGGQPPAAPPGPWPSA
ncbi:glycerophosphoryl diester phosphodiesterase membrane domain-containing protein [Paenarthrobacter nicotinovorans]|uniref:glycerophosphoryl diester phosphodiesterase membrane domain-containing protein n=1 Tax=Paenarthrobacter nicotinovorans TaxID=29320 RepID=UPI001FD7CC31|nr:glycerophosphoryl diester phosphodiesterase membrane domain-containing protein [Paenarthrobacter nicotinovorans]